MEMPHVLHCPDAVLCVCSVVSDSLQPHGLWPARLLCPWDSPARILEWVAMPFSRYLPNDPGIEPVSLASPVWTDEFFTQDSLAKWSLAQHPIWFSNVLLDFRGGGNSSYNDQNVYCKYFTYMYKKFGFPASTHSFNESCVKRGKMELCFLLPEVYPQSFTISKITW